MARPSLPIGTWGSISAQKRPNGQWVARARFRDHDGVTRKVEASGRTKGAAENNLRERLSERAQTSGADVPASTRLKVAADLWLREDVEPSDLAINTKLRYREIAEDKVIPVMGNLALHECSVKRIHRALGKIRDTYGVATANLARSVLTGVFRYAVESGGMQTNPMRDIASFSSPAPEVRALTIDESVALRRDLAGDKRAVRAGLPPIVAVLFATGCRIGEAIALRVDEDVDLEQGLVFIAGTVVRKRGEGLIRQDTTKGKKARPVRIPDWALEELETHLNNDLVDFSQGWLFPTATGTLREVSTLNGQWRKFRARHPRWEWTSFHTIRKTVATAVERADGLDVASKLLGHAGTSVTELHYVVPADLPDVRDTLGVFAV